MYFFLCGSKIRKRKANWVGHILRRNCHLQRFIEGKIKGRIEVIGRRGRRRRKLLDDLKERRGYSHLKEEALDRTMWRAGFGRGCGPVVRQSTKWMNGTTAPSWLGHPHYPGFSITLRRTALCRTPPDERSDQRRGLYLTTYNTHKRHIWKCNSTKSLHGCSLEGQRCFQFVLSPLLNKGLVVAWRNKYLL
jgi:hypothetical protein